MEFGHSYDEPFPDMQMGQAQAFGVPPHIPTQIPGIMMQQAYDEDDFADYDDEYAYDEPEDMQAFHCLYFPEDCKGAELPSGAVYTLPKANATGNVPLEPGILSGLDPLSAFVDILLVLIVCIGLHMAWEEMSKAKQEDKQGRYSLQWIIRNLTSYLRFEGEIQAKLK
jgi:hypothetical protein